MPYFTFLYSFCFRPFLSYNIKAKGINYQRNPNRFIKSTESAYFIDNFQRLYSNRIAKLLEKQDILSDINSRITKYFDNLYIDEIQDFAGHDFNFLKSITKANLDITFVGDFYQHTFDTSRDGAVNKNLHDDYNRYKNNFKEMGLIVDCDTLDKSYRCSSSLCRFITENLGIEIDSHRTEETNIQYVEQPDQAELLFDNKEIIKLFYSEHYKYSCFSKNWGDCKGESKYFDICVVLNKNTFHHYKAGTLKDLKSQTKNKLYVACSRARGDVFFVSDELYKKFKINT